MVLVQELHTETEDRQYLGIHKVFGFISEISPLFDLRSECIRVISDLIEFRCSQNTNVSVGPPAQAQLLAVSLDKDTKRHLCETNSGI